VLKILKWALLGAGIGVAVAAVNAYRRDQPVDTLATEAVKLGAAGAVAGATAAWLGSRRVVTIAKAAHAADLVRPAVVAALPYLRRAQPIVERAVGEIGGRLTGDHQGTAAA
jgi:hypothetical protein